MSWRRVSVVSVRVGVAFAALGASVLVSSAVGSRLTGGSLASILALKSACEHRALKVVAIFWATVSPFPSAI